MGKQTLLISSRTKQWRIFMLTAILLSLSFSLFSTSSFSTQNILMVLSTPEVSKAHLMVIVLSDREAFESREMIRQTWAHDHENIFFMVGEQSCLYPPEQRILGTCTFNNKTVPFDSIRKYQLEAETTSRRLRHESDVVLLPVMDIYEQLPRKLKESYKWILRNTDGKWILTAFDDTYVRFQRLEEYLKNKCNDENPMLIGGTEGTANIIPSDNSFYYEKAHFISSGQIVPRWMAKNIVFHDDTDPFLKRRKELLNQSVQWQTSESMINTGSCNDTSKLVITHLTPSSTMYSCFQIDRIHFDRAIEGDRNMVLKSNIENPGNYLHWSRFDMIIKLVYAYYYSVYRYVPDILGHVYTEHLLESNKLPENCYGLNQHLFDAKVLCKNVTSKSDLVVSFQRTIERLQEDGSNPYRSQISVDENGIILKGTHALAASIVLSKNATLQYLDTTSFQPRNHLTFKNLRLQSNLTDLIMLEWIRIQLKLPNLSSKVFILSVYSNSSLKDKEMRQIVREKCSKDKGILYEKTITVNKFGMGQLMKHMYGYPSWIDTKIKHMLTFFTSSSFTIKFVFFYGKQLNERLACKNEIRNLYNSTKYYKSTAHIPDTLEDILILAEMILNPNSIQFLNFAKNGEKCQKVAEEIARRSSMKKIRSIPGIYLWKKELMLDTGFVLYLFNLRNTTDTNILFLEETDKIIWRKEKGYHKEVHASKSKTMKRRHSLAEDHFNEKVKTKWDLFFDPRNYGFCYGIKFVSLQQIDRFKLSLGTEEKQK